MQPSTKQTLEYQSPSTATSTSRLATYSVLLATLLVPASFIASVLLRRHQLSLPDPYNNPYTNWSIACLGGFFALAVTDIVLIAIFGKRVGRPVRLLAWFVVVLAGLFVARFVMGMLRFVFA